MTNIPAISIPLNGNYLIEASAGTGKTWTLTGILLRQIIEAGVPCEKIIATTFTRSAASDMRQRFKERLQEFYQLLQSCIQLEQQLVFQKKQTNHENFWHNLNQQIINSPLQDKLQDPIYQYLINDILKKIANNQPAQPKKQGFYLALQRAYQALNQLDKLFIGTLDSLCQKWLREFSVETGYQNNVQISQQTEHLIKNLVHDQLRAYRADIYQKSATIYQIMQTLKQLPKVDDYLDSIKKALDFYSTPIDDVTLAPVDLSLIQQLIDKIIITDLSPLKLYQDENFRKTVGIRGNSSIHKNIYSLDELIVNLKLNGVVAVFTMSKSQEDLLNSMLECQNNPNDKLFNKAYQAQRQDFLNIELVQFLIELYQQKQHILAYIQGLNDKFHVFICRYVRNTLPQVLESQQKTTFALQLARLNQALSDKQHRSLARHIRYLYPIALIDEAQDINTEQALLIQQIYFDDKKSTTKLGFLLLVGDPKQAIYGFRGGDVNNYTAIKSYFQNRLELTENYRSAKVLIDGLNHWFGLPDPAMNVDIHETKAPYYLGEQIVYRHIYATKVASELINSQPSASDEKAIYLINIDSENLDNHIYVADAVVAQILSIFDKENYYYQDKPLKFSDVAILADKNLQLDEIDKKLQQAGVPTMRGGMQSVFAGKMSQDILILMQTLLYPSDEKRLKRLLLSSFFQLNASMAEKFMDSPAFGLLQELIHETAKYWQKYGFLAAIQWLLNQPSQPNQLFSEQNNFWQRLANHPEGERLLIDLRQLLDIISQHQQGMGEHQLFDWFSSHHQQQTKEEWSIQQNLPSDDGVQLMTIHKSKGLEFAVVFVVGLDKEIKENANKYHLYLYTDNYPHSKPLLKRRLSPVAYRQQQPKFYHDLEKQSLLEEKLRLTYVALTRAKERIYLFTEQHKGKNKTLIDKVALSKWLEDKKFTIPDYLQSHIQPITLNSLSKYLQTNNQSPLSKSKEQNQKNKPTKPIIDYQKWQAQIQKKQFYGWSNTSFTALLRYIDDKDKQSFVSNQPDYQSEYDLDDEYPETLPMSTNHENSENIALRFGFEKGAIAGTFLHKVLEEIGSHNHLSSLIQDTNQESWQQPHKQLSQIIDRNVKNYQLPNHYLSDFEEILQNTQIINQHMQLATWITDILQTPFQLSKKSLLQIPVKSRISELSFNMRMQKNFNLTALKQLFLQHNISLNLQNHYQHWRYLRGEIDLVYENDGRYYIVDYKSNYLGNRFEHYQLPLLQQAMNEHCYWLQAAIYQVALHRYLSVRLQNYDISQHLGGVEYAFLRGISQQKVGFGQLTWVLTPAFILALDALIG